MISFLNPLVLLALLSLPVLWRLLHLMPPKPQRVVFAPFFLLKQRASSTRQNKRAPWWVVLLRLLMLAAVIVAVAHPLWRPLETINIKRKNVVLLLSNDAFAAADWQDRQIAATSVLEQLSSDESQISVILTSELVSEHARIDFLPYADVRSKLNRMQPVSWTVENGNAINTLYDLLAKQGLEKQDVGIWWIASVDQQVKTASTKSAINQLSKNFDVTLIQAPTNKPYIRSAEAGPDGVKITLSRISTENQMAGQIELLDDRQRVVDGQLYEFSKGQSSLEIQAKLPQLILSQINQIRLNDAPFVPARRLVDPAMFSRNIALISQEKLNEQSALLQSDHYLKKAFASKAQIDRIDRRTESILQALKDRYSALILVDTVIEDEKLYRALENWVTAGGMLIRFVGPQQAEKSDELTAIPLRRSTRRLGGNLSLDKSAVLGEFSTNSPFAQLKVPTDVKVERYVLPIQTSQSEESSWARLSEGAPLISGKSLGRGWLVQFHVPAVPGWSNLPISGSFVELMTKLLEWSPVIGPNVALDNNGRAGAISEFNNEAPKKAALFNKSQLKATSIFNPYGELMPAPKTTISVAYTDLLNELPNQVHPPGFYVSTENSETIPIAHNLFNQETEAYVPIKADAELVELNMAQLLNANIPLTGPLFLVALCLLVVDCLVMLLRHRGFNLFRSQRFVAPTVLMFVIFGLITSAQSQNLDELKDYELLTTSLAYIPIGDPFLDDVVKKGLNVISQEVTTRTSFDPGPVVEIDLEKDDLAFFPLIYWPVDWRGKTPGEAEMDKIRRYLELGGMILFDTREPDVTLPTQARPNLLKLQTLLEMLKPPILKRVPGNHVLTRSFYLINDFPGYYDDKTLWIDEYGLKSGLFDFSVSQGSNIEYEVSEGNQLAQVLVTNADFVSTWANEQAMDFNAFFFPATPKREMSIRAGVNIVLYALTGTYKADQYHINSLVEKFE